MFQKHKAILFDMDGVIVHTMPDHFLAWQMTLQSIGITVSELDIYVREGEPGMVTLSELLAKYGRELTFEERQNLLQQKESLLKKIVSPRLFPGIEHLIEEARAKGYRLALVTGTSKNEVEAILPNRLSSLFEVIVTGDSVSRESPALTLTSRRSTAWAFKLMKPLSLKTLLMEFSQPRQRAWSVSR